MTVAVGIHLPPVASTFDGMPDDPASEPVDEDENEEDAHGAGSDAPMI